VHERTELLALDAAEAYINVMRYMRLVGISEDNLRVHRSLFDNVQQRFNGGRAGEGDLEQTRERVENAEALAAGFRQSSMSARKLSQSVGLSLITCARRCGSPACRRHAMKPLRPR